MRVPLPGRDYFPARVLLREKPLALRDMPRADRRISGMNGVVALPMSYAAMPASPPAPMASLQPVAA